MADDRSGLLLRSARPRGWSTRLVATGLMAGVVVAGFAALWMLLFLLPHQLVPDLTEAELDAAGIQDATERLAQQEARLQRRDNVRGTLLQVVAGLALASGAVATWRTLRLTRKKEETDRFANAAELLGHSNKSVKTAGLFALGRMVEDHEAERSTVVELLCAYVREHAPWDSTQPTDRTSPETRLLAVRSPDVQAALRVLGRISGDDTPSSLASVDLTLSDLTDADFAGTDFTSACLDKARLTGARLNGARLQNASLRFVAEVSGTDLTGANLQAADLTGAGLHGAILTGANLAEARLHGARLNTIDLTSVRSLMAADLSEAVLTSADLAGVNLAGANLTAAILYRATLSDANLASATLSNANLMLATLVNAKLFRAELTSASVQGANLTQANLAEADLSGANLTDSNLTAASLVGANLTRANLTSANFMDANLTRADLRGAWTTSSEPIWPAGYNPQAAGYQEGS